MNLRVPSPSSSLDTSAGARVAARFCCAWKAHGGQLEWQCAAGWCSTCTARGGVFFGGLTRKGSKKCKTKTPNNNGPGYCIKKASLKKTQFFGIVKWTFLMCLKIRNAHWWNLSLMGPAHVMFPPCNMEGPPFPWSVAEFLELLFFFPSYMYSTCVIKMIQKYI